MSTEQQEAFMVVKIKGLARLGEALLGLWLFASAFLWDHPHVQQMNMWIVGLGVIATAGVACLLPIVRFFNTALGMWLFASVFALPPLGPGGTLSDVLTSLVLIGLSLAPTSMGPAVKQRPWL